MNKIFAFLSVLTLALVPLLVSPSASAVGGWSGLRCKTYSSSAARVCTEVYLASEPTRITQLRLCAEKVPQQYFNGFVGTKESHWEVFGSNGDYKGGGGVDDVQNATTTLKCALTPAGFNVGLSACYTVWGTLQLNGWPDADYVINGGVNGGAC